MHTKPLKAALLVWFVFLLLVNGGYAMQPPPRPLNLAKFKELISLADIIVVGQVGEVQESEKMVKGRVQRTVTAGFKIDQVLKGKTPGMNIAIQESYVALNPSMPGGAGKGGVVAMKAGPSAYHGHYAKGMRLVVFLEKAAGNQGYRPLGSGSYNKYLGEFLIKNDGIKPFYFRFAEDMRQYAESEDQFVHLINRLGNSDS